jgi:predicted RNA-binding Zn ribbon-like protein
MKQSGEPLALELLNTRTRGPDRPLDRLDTPAGLEAWLGALAGRLTPPAGPLTERDLAAVRSLREAVAAAIGEARQGRCPPDAALRRLTEAERAAPAHRELGWDGRAVTVTSRRRGADGAVLLAELAAAAIDLLASPSIAAVRQCEGPGCVRLFLAAHPGRRWCSPEVCGNRVRVARHYRRHGRRPLSATSREDRPHGGALPARPD